MLERVATFIGDNDLLTQGAAVGVSGGVDSMVLLHVLVRLGYDVTAVHVNYGLRPGESEADERLVRSVCRQSGIPLVVVDAAREIIQGRPSGSIQAEARRIRYHRFVEIAKEREMDRVAVAHHEDDQVETVFLAMRRRAGFDGLAGMAAIRPLGGASGVRLVRPLLCVSRDEIRAWATEEGIPWREDRSNRDTRYTRVRLRLDVIPALAQLAGSDVRSEALELANAMRRLVDDALPNLLPDSLRFENLSGGAVDASALEALEPEVRAWYILRLMRRWIPGAPIRRTVVSEVEKLLTAPSGKRVQFKQGAVWKERTRLRFAQERAAPDAEAGPNMISLATSDGVAVGPFGRLTARTMTRIPERLITPANEILVDADCLSGELKVRPWKEGDRFQPIGMRGSRKVKSFLTDRKIESSRKKKVHVLCDDERIVWVLGMRMDSRFGVRPSTTSVVRISLDPVPGSN